VGGEAEDEPLEEADAGHREDVPCLVALFFVSCYVRFRKAGRGNVLCQVDVSPALPVELRHIQRVRR
jgi:hypothetical protein